MKVVLSKGAFLGILAASMEAFKKESIGLLFGSRGKESIKIKLAFPPQTAKRFYASAEIGTKAEKRLVKLFEDFAHMKLVGFFHSHPEYGEMQGETKMSSTDIASLKDGELAIIIAINNSRNSHEWQANSDGSISGTVDHFLFTMACFRKIREKKHRATMIPMHMEIRGLLLN
jgi:proteasome lid subunit RPN8/RPN11